jgi:hypothetical protein
MKFVAVTLLAFIAAAAAGPISVSDNNVGDIVTVGVNANLSLNNEINANLVSVIAAILNQQAIVVAANGNSLDAGAPNLPSEQLPKLPEISPEMIEKIKSMLTKH